MPGLLSSLDCSANRGSSEGGGGPFSVQGQALMTFHAKRRFSESHEMARTHRVTCVTYAALTRLWATLRLRRGVGEAKQPASSRKLTDLQGRQSRPWAGRSTERPWRVGAVFAGYSARGLGGGSGEGGVPRRIRAVLPALAQLPSRGLLRRPVSGRSGAVYEAAKCG